MSYSKLKIWRIFFYSAVFCLLLPKVRSLTKVFLKIPVRYKNFTSGVFFWSNNLTFPSIDCDIVLKTQCVIIVDFFLFTSLTTCFLKDEGLLNLMYFAKALFCKAYFLTGLFGVTKPRIDMETYLKVQNDFSCHMLLGGNEKKSEFFAKKKHK